jgi:hypothetical protein
MNMSSIEVSETTTSKASDLPVMLGDEEHVYVFVGTPPTPAAGGDGTGLIYTWTVTKDPVPATIEPGTAYTFTLDPREAVSDVSAVESEMPRSRIGLLVDDDHDGAVPASAPASDDDVNIGVGELQEATISKSMDIDAESEQFGLADGAHPLDGHIGGAMFGFSDGVKHGGAIAGIVIAATSDNNNSDTNEEAANLCDGSVCLLGTSDALSASDFILI